MADLDDVQGTVAIGSMLVLLAFRNYLYETFQKTHYALAIVLVYATWKHVGFKPVFSRLYLWIAAAVFVVSSTARYVRMIARNVT